MQYSASTLQLPAANAGQLVFNEQVGGRTIIVREDASWRWLMLAANGERLGRDTPLQSVMRKDSPALLVLPYMQCLCLPLCWSILPSQPRVLHLGLGGGAIDRFLLHNRLVSSLVTVESEAELFRVCRNHFALDACTDASHRLETATALDFLNGCTERFDWIVCDIHDGSGLPDDMLDSQFYARLDECLDNSGVVCFNIADRRDQRLATLDKYLRERFAHCWYAEVGGFENVLVFVSKLRFSPLEERINILQQLFTENVSALLSSMIYAPSVSATRNN